MTKGARNRLIRRGAKTPVTASAEPMLRMSSVRGRWVLLATILGSGVASLDATVVNVALPRIGDDLTAGLTSLQWILNAYTLTLAGLLLMGGALGDAYGRRRVFMLGVIWFALASAGCAVAPDAQVLIGMRALQGVGGALLTPGSLAILEASFVRQDRAAAVGAWSGLAGVATALGPILGGLLVGAAPWGWRVAFLINVPLAAVVVAVTARHVPETRDQRPAGRLDIAGAMLAAGSLAGIVYGLTEGPQSRWNAPALLCLGLGAMALAVFVVVESRAGHPMLPLELFRSRQFSAANAVTVVIYAALGGAFFLLPLQLQRGSGFTPVAAGSALLPITVLMLALSARMGRLASRLGPRLPMSIGPIVVGAGLALMVRIGERASYVADVLPAVLVLGLGLAITVAPLTATVLAAAPDRQAGVASAVNNDLARTAGLLAVALLPAAIGLSASDYQDAVALTGHFRIGVLAMAGLCALGGLLAAITIGNEQALGTPIADSCAHCSLSGPTVALAALGSGTGDDHR